MTWSITRRIYLPPIHPPINLVSYLPTYYPPTTYFLFTYLPTYTFSPTYLHTYLILIIKYNH
jgi:hypothetical protein